ncbi:MAG TPA: glycosyltransferase family 4 protein [Chthoniobacteraceae bacterium]|nr:glycosyltransferase family 4 protein [Chthoniobacteraceae bacterium]
MRILVAALACAPVGSSEEFLGWQAILAISQNHDVWVVTAERNRASIEHAKALGTVTKVHFRYIEGYRRWVRNATLFRLQAWLEYISWSRRLLSFARDLHTQVHFDLAHHVTYSAWRVPSPLWRLDIPLVWGPIGGAGNMPIKFFYSMSLSGMFFETLRKIAQFAAYLPGPRRCAREAACVLASNSETAALLQKMRRSSEALTTMWPTYFSDVQIRKFVRAKPLRSEAEPLRIFAGGTALGSKGVALALRGLRRVADRRVSFIYTVACEGPECAYLRELRDALDLNASVRFVSKYAAGAYFQELQRSDCYLMPSFRENLGLTLIEAMMAGAVPIVADISAPGEIVTAQCGIKVPVTSPAEMISAIANAVEGLARNPRRAYELGMRASARAREVMSASVYQQGIEMAYRLALGGQPFYRLTKTRFGTEAGQRSPLRERGSIRETLAA